MQLSMRSRSTIVILAALVGVAVLVAPPAEAGKKKRKVEGSFDVQAIPYPVTSAINEVGCAGGTEGMHKGSANLKAPFDGFLTVEVTGFQGDWDVHIQEASGWTLASGTSDNLTENVGVERAEVLLDKGDKVVIVACNWLGSPNAHVSYVLEP